jgi:hypothetical protein
MVRKNDEAGRGRHLAPALEVVSADTPDYSRALITKQAELSADLLFRWLSSTHAVQQTAFGPELCDRGYGTWIPLAVPVNKIIAALAETIQHQRIERRPTITTANPEVRL